MTDKLIELQQRLQQHFAAVMPDSCLAVKELTLTVPAGQWQSVCTDLRDQFDFEELIDLTVVDYLDYGKTEWRSDSGAAAGFGRGLQPGSAGRFTFDDMPPAEPFKGARFAVVVHLLSLDKNTRLRVKAYCDSNDAPEIATLVNVWSVANWFEREAFDLFGVIFRGHPDLRRLLTDYGFVGHPFRKDFPLIGHVEMRYDPEQGRVIYEPVSIEPRVLTPRIIREGVDDNGNSHA